MRQTTLQVFSKWDLTHCAEVGLIDGAVPSGPSGQRAVREISLTGRIEGARSLCPANFE